MLTKHNVYSAKVILFSDSTKGFIYYFTSEYVFSSFRGFQDRFSRENLDRSPTIVYMYYIVDLIYQLSIELSADTHLTSEVVSALFHYQS